ncbi:MULTISPECIES: hypothetical protein [Serratia]|jgi:hypothetical protein|uniref:hypothetical protein n=1 Tax=Serratia TaxID=613 RepID=UPI0021B77AF9|nr:MULTISPECIES: hypothetical protein [Serratia]
MKFIKLNLLSFSLASLVSLAFIPGVSAAGDCSQSCKEAQSSKCLTGMPSASCIAKHFECERCAIKEQGDKNKNPG